ncbi:MAG: acetate--CoA ligase family protein, partial [Actinomycetota bacterium]
LDLPEFAKPTQKALHKALPSVANVNNPLDVTGQASVETDMYEDALTALAHDPAIGFVLMDIPAPRGDVVEEGAWAEPMLARARNLQRETGVVFASLAMSPMAYPSASKGFVERQKLPFLQGHRAASGAIKALIDLQGAKARMTTEREAHPNRAKALRVLKGLSGPIDEATGAKVFELYGVKRPKEATVTTPEAAARAAAKIKGPVAIKALAPEIPHKAKLGGVKLDLETADEVEAAAADVLEAARRGGALSPKILVQQMASGHEVLIGVVIDEDLGACITIRPGGALAEAGEATFVAAPLTAKQARAFVDDQAERCGLDPARHHLASLAKAVEAIARAAHDLRGRLSSLEANPMLVGATGSLAVDALAEARGEPVSLHGHNTKTGSSPDR